jgi:hypothetical protein
MKTMIRLPLIVLYKLAYQSAMKRLRKEAPQPFQLNWR